MWLFAFAGGLYTRMIMVLLSTTITAELFITVSLALPTTTGRWRTVGDEAVALLATRQLPGRGYEPVKLEVHSS